MLGRPSRAVSISGLLLVSDKSRHESMVSSQTAIAMRHNVIRNQYLSGSAGNQILSSRLLETTTKSPLGQEALARSGMWRFLQKRCRKKIEDRSRTQLSRP
jgi:hypothetical protein